MTYQVLARKWRPQTFKDMVGQDHISSTLCNAIKNQRVGHAYLFVGTRGTGKTTTARIFAKAINCENPLPDANPCDQCTNCKEITAGSCMDVLEIDGASNNGVDDIRRLRDNVQYTPARCSFKVYIIDEVHMLSTAAWNALLKTLEEPPEHVKFLFATTEVHKVLPTILSRCQRFDLKRISQGTISRRLQEIAHEENAHFDQSALNAIARAANGGMRDALSIMDQMIAFCNNQETISEHDVSEVFGLTSNNDLAKITIAMLNDNAAELIKELNHLADVGRNLEQLYSDLLHFSRNLMICAISGNQAKSILDLDDHEISLARNIVSQTNTDTLQRMVDGYLAHDGQLRNTLNKRVFLEMTLVRIMKDAHAASLNDILKRLNTLRKTGSLAALEVEAPKNNIEVSLPETEKKNLNNSSPAPVEQKISEPVPEIKNVTTPEPAPTSLSVETPAVQETVIQEAPKEDIKNLEPQSIEEAPTPQEYVNKEEDKPDYLSFAPQNLQTEENPVPDQAIIVQDAPGSQETIQPEPQEEIEVEAPQEVTPQPPIEPPSIPVNSIEKITIDDSLSLPYNTLIDTEYISKARLKDPCQFGLQRYQADFNENEETPGSALGVFYYKEANTDIQEEKAAATPEPEVTETPQQEYIPEQYTNIPVQEEAPQAVEQITLPAETGYEPITPQTQALEEVPSVTTQIVTDEAHIEKPEDSATRIWNNCQESINQQNPVYLDILRSLTPISYSENTFILTTELSIDSLQEISELIKNIIIHVEPVADLDIKIVTATANTEENGRKLSSNEEVWGRVNNNPLFTQLCQEFDGTIIDVRG